MQDLSKLDLMGLVRQAISLFNKEKDKIELDFLSEYLTISTEGLSLTDPTVDLDVNKVRFSGETQEDITFIDVDLLPFVYKVSDYGERWIYLNQKGILGSLITKAYDDLILAIKNQVPHHLKDKVK